MTMYTGVLDVLVRNKNLKVPEWKLTESCLIVVQRLYVGGLNMLSAYLNHII